MAKICIVQAEGTGGFEPGDVAFCKDDDKPWGAAILGNPKFRLLEVPGISGKDASELLCTPQPGDRRENPNLKKRAVRIDIAALEIGTIFGNFERHTRNRVQAVRQVKPIPQAPAVR